jgi:serine/threonine protein kinase
MPLPLSTQVGPYQILGLLGKGGMGEVYRAHDSRLNRIVAIKVLKAEGAADNSYRRRFEQEAKLAGSLNHPNVLAIYDVGSLNGQLYLVSEYLEGKTLRQRLNDGVLPTRKVLEYATQIARGLAAAHRKGITHRDLKPENLFLANDGQLKILDFGLARLTRSAAAGAEHANLQTESMTGPGVVMGTPAYMAPEQVRGHDTDHRSDIFSFGAVLHEMVSGKRTFQGESSVEVMNAIVHDEPADVSACTSPQLDLIIKRCLEKCPDDRFDTARDLTFALEALCTETSSHKASQSAPPQTRSRKLMIGTALVLSFLSGGAVSFWLRRPGPTDNALPRYLTYSGRDSSPAISPDGKTVAFASDRDGRSKIWLKHLGGGSEVPLTAGSDDNPRFSPDGSTILFSRTDGLRTSLYRVGILGGETHKIIDDVTTADFSPDGRRIAFLRWHSERAHVSSTVGIVAVDGSGAKEIADSDALRLDFPRWSPDGLHIAALGGLQGGFVRVALLVMSADGRSSRFLATPGASLGLSAVGWSSNEEVVYLKGDRTAGESASLIRQNIKSGVSQSSEWGHQGLVLDIARTGTGTMVFDTQAGRSSLREFALTRKFSRDRDRWLARGSSMDREPAYSPDGRRLVFCSSRSGNMDIWQIDLETGSVSRLTDHPGIDWDPAFTPDGKGLIWSSNRTGNPEVYISDAEGAGVRQVTRDGRSAENPTMTADGQWIVYSSGDDVKRGIWKIHPDGNAAMSLASGPYFNPEVSPDGQYALFVTTVRADKNAIRVVRIADGSAIPFEIACNIRRQSGWLIGRARWMPSGRAIAFVGQNDKGVNGIYVQDFVPGAETSASRRELGGFDPDVATETLGISPDGSHITISTWELVSSIMIADRVPRIATYLKPAN